MENEIKKGINFREKGEDSKAFELFRKLLEKSPTDPILNYQMAWTWEHISMSGKI